MAIIESGNFDTPVNGGISDAPNDGTVIDGADNGVVSGVSSGPLNPADESVKRGRGRPKGSGKSGTAGTAGRIGTESQERKESTSGTGAKKAPLVVGDLAVQLEAVHKMAALVLKNPLVEISPAESQKLAAALANVAKHYDFKVNPAIMAWMQLVGVGAAVYGPRVAITIQAKKATRQAQQQTAPSNVQPIRTEPETPSGQYRFQ